MSSPTRTRTDRFSATVRPPALRAQIVKVVSSVICAVRSCSAAPDPAQVLHVASSQSPAAKR
jgi:hypothetical protein